MSSATKPAALQALKFVYTLPMNCQICLDQVRTPVICPNLHLFCRACIEVWLESHKQCPTCRVDIGENNCRVLRGAPDNGEFDSVLDVRLSRLSTRSKVLAKDYQKETKAMSRELKKMKGELEFAQQTMTARITAMEEALSSVSPSSRTAANLETEGVEPKAKRKISYCSTCGWDSTNMEERNTDLEKENDELKQQVAKIEHENTLLRDEVRRLRPGVSSYSPKKQSWYAAAAECSQRTALEREISQLKRALERSDRCIEDLRKQHPDTGTSGESLVEVKKEPSAPTLVQATPILPVPALAALTSVSSGEHHLHVPPACASLSGPGTTESGSLPVRSSSSRTSSTCSTSIPSFSTGPVVGEGDLSFSCASHVRLDFGEAQLRTVASSINAAQLRTVASSRNATQLQTIASSCNATQLQTVPSSCKATQLQTIPSNSNATQLQTVASNSNATQLQTVASNSNATQLQTVASNSNATQLQTIASSSIADGATLCGTSEQRSPLSVEQHVTGLSGELSLLSSA